MDQEKINIAVGSKNPVKITAVRNAFKKVWPSKKWHIFGVSVDSGVSLQPLTDAESIAGAKNRAHVARKISGATYGVGLEGGLQQINGLWFDCGWIVVADKKGVEGIGSTVRVHTPQAMMDQIKKGYELGEVIDMLFQTSNARQKEGHFGLMTNNHITRTRGYTDGVIMALSRFMHPQLFSN